MSATGPARLSRETTVRSWLGPLAFWPGFVLWTTLMTAALLVLLPLPYGRRLAFTRYWSRFNIWWIRVTLGIRHRVHGLEHVPDGPVVVLCKHQSTWETLVLQDILPPQVWVLKRELLWIPVIGWGFALTGAIALDRRRGKAAVQKLLERGTARLKAGHSVLIFPEGTRIPVGQRGRFKIGGALLATHAGVPVLPVAHNAGYLWPRHGWRKWPGTVDLVIGPPVDTTGLEPEEVNRRVQEWIEARVEALGPPKD